MKILRGSHLLLDVMGLGDTVFLGVAFLSQVSAWLFIAYTYLFFVFGDYFLDFFYSHAIIELFHVEHSYMRFNMFTRKQADFIRNSLDDRVAILRRKYRAESNPGIQD